MPGKDAAGGSGSVCEDEGAAGCGPNLDQLIDNFDRALSHPDAADLENLRQEILK